jgi:hypothetical protein
MYLAYYDEAGDDGYPQYSSPLFVLSAVYLFHGDWKACFQKIQLFRRQLHIDFKFPTTREIHTREFLLNKKPYRQLNLSDADRIHIVELWCELLANLPVRVVNVVIDKAKIKTSNYGVLDSSLTYSIQRIENDLSQMSPASKFLIITDAGRLAPMRATARKIQRFNPIPSKFGPQPYRKEIENLVEDPLPKDSRESYFIQFADLVAFTVYQHCLTTLGAGSPCHRMPHDITPAKIVQWLEILKPSLNLKASATHPYGIVIYPK